MNLYYVKNGRIVKITPYEEVIDVKTGKRKVLVDFSDLRSMTTCGLALNYDQHFPAGASFFVQSGVLMGSLDIGVNLDNKKYTTEKMAISDIMNYSYTKTKYDPKAFITLTPSLFLKFVSIGCGVGVVWLGSEKNTQEQTSTFDADNQLTGYGTGTSSVEDDAFKLMFRPQVRGFLPIGKEWYMSVGAGYDFIPSMKDLNGYHLSIGFHVNTIL